MPQPFAEWLNQLPFLRKDRLRESAAEPPGKGSVDHAGNLSPSDLDIDELQPEMTDNH
jgi:hypothetical protein